MNNVPQGAYVQQVVSGSPADKAGVQKGDIIVKIDGERLGEDQKALSSIISHKKIGQTVSITVFRENNTTDLKTTITAAPNQ